MRLRRKQLGVSQEKMAVMLGLTFQQIQKYERGVNRISAGRLFDIAKVLEAPISFFYDGLADDTTGARGVAEEKSPYAHPLPPETGDLIAAFATISDAKMRRKIIEMARLLASATNPNIGDED